MITRTSWDLGVKVGLPIAIVVGLVLLALAAVTYRYIIRNFRTRIDRYGWSDRFVCSVVGAVVSTVGLIGLLTGTLIGYYPYKAEYHQFRWNTGRVTSIAAPFSAASNVYQLTIDGLGQRTCADTRCAAVHIGDTVTLSCIRHYQYSGTNPYICSFVSNRQAAA